MGEPYTFTDHELNRLKIERGGSIKGRGVTLATVESGSPEDWADPVFVPAAAVEQVAQAMFEAAGRPVVIVDRIEEIPTRKWDAGRCATRLNSSGEVVLAWGGGEIEMHPDAADLVAAALAQAAAAQRAEPATADVETLANKLSFFDSTWNREAPGDHHYDQARRLLRTHDVTEREAGRG